MKKIVIAGIVALTAVAATGSAHATTCSTFGSNSYFTTSCSDGNNYSTSRYGNTSTTYGNNYNTGSSWSQTTTRYGNSSTTTYNDSRGNYKTCYTNTWGTTCY